MIKRTRCSECKHVSRGIDQNGLNLILICKKDFNECLNRCDDYCEEWEENMGYNACVCLNGCRNEILDFRKKHDVKPF